MTYSSLSDSDASHVMLFDLLSGGHHGTYLRYLVQAWLQAPFSTRLTLVVSPQFLTVHQEVAALVETHPQIELIAISAAHEAERKQASGVKLGFVEWRIFCQLAKKIRATHAMLMYFDYFQLAIVFGQPSPCSFSAIYFRPTFHYQTFAQTTLTLKDRVRSWRQKVLLTLALKNPQLQTLFCLDPFAIKAIQQLQQCPTIVHLPDPVEVIPVSAQSVADLRLELGIEQNRQVFLLFGRLTERKGVYALLKSLKQLSPESCQQICILLVGEILGQDKAKIRQEVTELCQCLPVQILIHDRFLREAEVPSYFHLADIVLALYQRHVGMSGILLLAAAAQKPILVSDYGLMRELARQYELGLVIDSGDISQIARSLINCLDNSKRISNPEKMKDFVQANLWARYASTIVETFNA
ncbi:MAG TPA: glycosyltransferase family 4 protein [Leptolyngbya sp.]|jgi:glycosyltransferase involved in cell wall biosynthesis|nr:glycosyltransferase family 4 protein [Leptolyngbya sp.]